MPVQYVIDVFQRPVKSFGVIRLKQIGEGIIGYGVVFVMTDTTSCVYGNMNLKSKLGLKGYNP